MAFSPIKVSSLFAGQPAPPVVGVAAFGKHPSYADHLPIEVGDQSPLAARLRQTLYNGGILTRVGDWDGLQKAGKAIPFGHFVFYREIDAQASAGEASALVRLWPSRDSVNRSDIPMALAACGTGVPAAWVVKNGAEVLSAAQSRCEAAATLEELTAAVGSATANLRARLESAAALPGAPAVSASAELVAALRAIRDYVPVDGPSKFNLPDRPAVARVTPLAQTPVEAIGAWSRLLDAALAGRKTRYFIVAPDGGEWIDLVLGEPAGRHFSCIRSGLAAMPMAAPGENELADAFGQGAVAWLAGLNGKSVQAPASVAPSPALPVKPVKSGSPMLLAGGGVVLLIAIGVAGYFALHGGSSTVAQAPAPAQPNPPPAKEPVVAPAPTPPPLPVEADPRPQWNLTGLAQDLAAAQKNAGAINQLKTALADIPAGAAAIATPPDPSRLSAAVNLIQTAQWPHDKSLIEEQKNFVDQVWGTPQWAALKSPDAPAKAWSQALDALRKVKFQLPAVQARWDKLAGDSRLESGYSADPFPVALPEAFKRLSALDQAVGAAPQADALAAELDAAASDAGASAQSLVDDYRNRVQQAGRRTAAAQAVGAAVAQADQLLAQPDPSAARLNSVMAQLSAVSVADLSPADAAAVKQRQGDIDALSQDIALTDPAAQIQSSHTAAMAVAIWRKWLAAGPAGRPVAEDAAVFKAVAAKCPDEALAREIAAKSAARWIARFDALWTAPQPPGDADITAILGAAANAGVSQPGTALIGLSHSNYLLYQLKTAKTDEQTTAAARELLAALQPSPLFTQISDALTPAAAPGEAQGPENLPGVSRVSGDRDSAVVKYKCLNTTVSFIRVGNSYLAADEFPAGLFVDLAAQEKWSEEALDIKLSYIEQRGDRGIFQRLIPRSWEWNADAGKVELHSAWITTGDGSADAFLASADKDDAVTVHSPVQYLKPEAAQKIAATLGCRLPTAAEWQAARNLGGGPAQRISAADRAAYLAFVANSIKARPPTEFMFAYPPDAPADAAPGVHGRVWFAPVVSDNDSLRDLDGNLAEFVTSGGEVKVAGASAWSGDAAKADDLHDLDAAKRQYADVGFRLAYNAPSAPPAALLRQIAAKAPYQMAPR